MLRGLFTIFTSLTVGASGLIINKKLFYSDYRHYASEDSIPLKETDKAHWTYLSSLLMFAEDDGENDGASSFFGIRKVVRDPEDKTKIKLDDADGVTENSDRLRIKCYEYFNRIKKSPFQRDPSPTTIQLIKDWCFANSPKFPSKFQQFKGFFDWEHTYNKRVFITTNKPPHDANSTSVELPGFFLVNLLPYFDVLGNISNVSSQENKVLKYFSKIFTSDFYTCLYYEGNPNQRKYKNRYWIGYSEDGDGITIPKNDNGTNLCKSNDGENKGWMTYFYNVTNSQNVIITHYKIAKNSAEIKKLISPSQAT